jgi:hypothetical protein
LHTSIVWFSLEKQRIWLRKIIAILRIMNLSPTQYKEYLRVHYELLFFVAKKYKLIPKNWTLLKFRNDSDLEKKFTARNKLLENPTDVDEYVSLHPKLSEQERGVFLNFKKTIRGKFIILRCLKKYAIFYHEKSEKFYAVKALGDRFDEMLWGFPVLVGATLLPFWDQIVYDGFLTGWNVFIGRNIEAEIHEQYMEAKKNKEIIFSLL